MNNKWIVPIVAILLCAVSLIGAGYAALSATLVDTETTHIDNDYLKLTLNNSKTIDQSFDLEWKQEINYGEATFQNVKYTVQDSTDQVLKFQIDKAASYTAAPNQGDGTQYNIDGTNKDTTAYNLTISAVTITRVAETAADLTGTFIAANVGELKLAIYESDGTTTKCGFISVDDGKYVFEGLSYDTQYIIKANYDALTSPVTKNYVNKESPAESEIKATTPDAAFTAFAGFLPDTLGLTLTAEAVITSENMTIITFDANGGTGTMADQFIKQETTEALSTNTYTYEGKTFAGWATSADATEADYENGQAYTAAAAAGNVTLYAVWTANPAQSP